jgi:glycyl-tRNA synthetase beta chain
MTELLLELFSEEIPARMQQRAATDLAGLLTARLKEAGIDTGDVTHFATPRRLTVVIGDLPEATADTREERRGPRTDAPEKAIEGFLRGSGITLDQAEVRETPKGSFYFAVIEKPGRATAELLAEILPSIIDDLPWPKSMRWGSHARRWVRPLQSILCLFGGKVVAFTADPVSAGDSTRGHRFMAPDSITVTGFADYRAKLAAAHVILDAEDRKTAIRNGAEKLAAANGLTLRADDGLLDEVAGLVEWPVPLIGRIDDKFMDVPPEVLVTSMRSHQKYFSLETADGKLAPHFILVANRETPDKGATITGGNERVLRARLSDAKFFWDQDRATSLESKTSNLSDIVFHADLGTLQEKVDRMTGLAGWLAERLPDCDPALAKRAAVLCKGDLVSGMVGEFPELQGIMGRYYALHDGEDTAVAEAIAAHYSPAGPADACPQAPVSAALALADKVDTLIGFWGIGQTPTGSKDPYALRRAALGVIRILLENGYRLPLTDVFAKAYALYDGKLPASLAGIQRDLMAFFADRLKVHLRGEGVRHDHVAAIFALGGEDDLVRLMRRVSALTDLLATEDGANLLAAYRRAANILRIEEKKDSTTYGPDPDAGLLADDAEKALHDALTSVAADCTRAGAAEDYSAAMTAMAGLRQPVDEFFEKVTVNADDASVRANRLKLLSQIRGVMEDVAIFSEIEG